MGIETIDGVRTHRGIGPKYLHPEPFIELIEQACSKREKQIGAAFVWTLGIVGGTEQDPGHENPVTVFPKLMEITNGQRILNIVSTVRKYSGSREGIIRIHERETHGCIDHQQ